MDFSMIQGRRVNLLYFKVICSQLRIVNLQDDTLIVWVFPHDLKGEGGWKNDGLFYQTDSSLYLYAILIQ